jgi:hypothetical protein
VFDAKAAAKADAPQPDRLAAARAFVSTAKDPQILAPLLATAANENRP